MRRSRWMCGLATATLLGLSACQSTPDAALVAPPEHPLEALYRARLSSDVFARGRASLAVGEPLRALEAWSALLFDTLTPAQLQAVVSEARAAGDFGLARVALEALLITNPNDATAHLNLGLLLAAVAPADAAPHLQAASNDPALAPLASAIQTSAVRSQQALGFALLDAGYWPEAELAFGAAAAGPESEPLVLAGLALSRDYQGKDGEAWMAAAVGRAPTEAAVFALQSIHHRIRGDLVGSLTAQQRAVALAPESAPLLAQLGMAYQRLGRLDEAAVWFERAQALAGDDPRYAALLDAATGSEAAALDAFLNSLAAPSESDAP